MPIRDRASKRAPFTQPLHEVPPQSGKRRGICGARKGDGTLCRSLAGAGTVHIGIGRCRTHGGNTQAGIRAAAVVIGEGSLIPDRPVMGQPLVMEPVAALTWCVQIAAGELAYCNWRVAQLTEEDAVARPDTITEESWGDGSRTKIEYGNPTLHLWIRERQKCVDRLARLSKMALDAGVAEREIAMAEQMAEVLARFGQGLLDDLGISRGSERLQSRAKAAVERQLLALTANTIDADIVGEAFRR